MDEKTVFCRSIVTELSIRTKGGQKTSFSNLYFEVDTTESVHCVERSLLFLMMPPDRNFIVKRLNGSSQKRSGWSILTHEK